MVFNFRTSDKSATFFALDLCLRFPRQQINQHKTEIVARFRVSVARISQTDDEPIFFSQRIHYFLRINNKIHTSPEENYYSSVPALSPSLLSPITSGSALPSSVAGSRSASLTKTNEATSASISA